MNFLKANVGIAHLKISVIRVFKYLLIIDFFSTVSVQWTLFIAKKQKLKREIKFINSEREREREREGERKREILYFKS